MTDLSRFQDDLREQGYIQVPRVELREKTYAITGTDVFVGVNGHVDRYIFTTEGKAAGAKTNTEKLRPVKYKVSSLEDEALTSEVIETLGSNNETVENGESGV